MRFESKGSLWYALTLVELKHLFGCYRLTSLKVENFSVPVYMQDGFLIPHFSKEGSKLLFTCPHKCWVPFEKLCSTQDVNGDGRQKWHTTFEMPVMFQNKSLRSGWISSNAIWHICMCKWTELPCLLKDSYVINTWRWLSWSHHSSVCMHHHSVSTSLFQNFETDLQPMEY